MSAATGTVGVIAVDTTNDWSATIGQYTDSCMQMKNIQLTSLGLDKQVIVVTYNNRQIYRFILDTSKGASIQIMYGMTRSTLSLANATDVSSYSTRLPYSLHVMPNDH
jgi:hypothetical protein